MNNFIIFFICWFCGFLLGALIGMLLIYKNQPKIGYIEHDNKTNKLHIVFDPKKTNKNITEDKIKEVSFDVVHGKDLSKLF